MRPVSLLAISTVLALACADSSQLSAPFPCRDSTGLSIGPACPPPEISLQGPAFLRAKIDTSLFSLQESDIIGWSLTGTTLVIDAQPGGLQPNGFTDINIQIANYAGPGTYRLQQTSNPGPVSAGFVSVFAGSPPVAVAGYQTWGDYRGAIRIIAADTTSGILVGKFEFSAVATTLGTGEVRVTDGSFRIACAWYSPTPCPATR